MLACYEATGEARYGEVALELGDLFRRRFLDPGTGALAEFFTDDWARAPGEPGRVVEPGHQFEWAWILANLQRLCGVDCTHQVRALVDFGERFGVDRATGVTFNQVSDTGTPIDRASRTWPNTERIKAQVALHDLFGEDSSGRIAQSVRLLLDRYLATSRAGLWVDLFDEGRQPMSATVPASTLYHVFLAFAEVLRLHPTGALPHVDNAGSAGQ
jgi:N-acylglucosamine 2-epimerase/mannose-6-phosphate isomerase